MILGVRPFPKLLLCRDLRSDSGVRKPHTCEAIDGQIIAATDLMACLLSCQVS